MAYIIDDVIYITKGDDESLSLARIQTTEGEEYPYGAGDTLTITVRETPSAESPVLLQAVSAPGSVDLNFGHEATSQIEPGSYSADVELQTAAGMRYTIWPDFRKDPAKYIKTRNWKNFCVNAEATI